MIHNIVNGDELEVYSSLANSFQTRVPQMISAPGPTVPNTPSSANDSPRRRKTNFLEIFSTYSALLTVFKPFLGSVGPQLEHFWCYPFLERILLIPFFPHWLTGEAGGISGRSVFLEDAPQKGNRRACLSKLPDLGFYPTILGTFVANGIFLRI